jgi:hypothetical protein
MHGMRAGTVMGRAAFGSVGWSGVTYSAEGVPPHGCTAIGTNPPRPSDVMPPTHRAPAVWPTIRVPLAELMRACACSERACMRRGSQAVAAIAGLSLHYTTSQSACVLHGLT